MHPRPQRPVQGRGCHQSPANSLDHIEVGGVLVGPIRHRLTVLGQHEDLAERRVQPVAWLKDHRHDPQAAFCLQHQRPLKFLLVAVVRSQIVRAYQRDEQAALLKRCADGLADVVTGDDGMIGPRLQAAIASEHNEVLMQPFEPLLVSVGIGDEGVMRHREQRLRRNLVALLSGSASPAAQQFNGQVGKSFLLCSN